MNSNLRLVQRTGSPHQTAEEQNLDAHHRVQHLQEPDSGEVENEGAGNISEVEVRRHVESEEENSTESRERVKWPGSRDITTWRKFEDDVEAVLESILAGPIDRKIEAMTTIIYAMGRDRFGCEERKPSTPQRQTPNRRSQKIAQLIKMRSTAVDEAI